MNTTKQNKVPFEFDSLYRPILNFKKAMQSKNKTLDAVTAIESLVMIHYSTFIMTQLDDIKNSENIRSLRNLTEEILSCDSYSFSAVEKSILFSYIDKLGKTLNTTLKPYVYIAIYNGYIHAEIYRHLHSEYKIFDFKEYLTINSQTLVKIKASSDASEALLNKMNLPIRLKQKND